MSCCPPTTKSESFGITPVSSISRGRPQRIKAVPGQPGRDATDPRILLALLAVCHLRRHGRARTLDGLCREHLAYQWLCGGLSLNYHTLADFRSQHTDILDQLLTDSVATMLYEKFITLKQVAQDGMRVSPPPAPRCSVGNPA